MAQASKRERASACTRLIAGLIQRFLACLSLSVCFLLPAIAACPSSLVAAQAHAARSSYTDKLIEVRDQSRGLGECMRLIK